MDADLFDNRSPGRLVRSVSGAFAFVPAPLPPAIDFGDLFVDYGEAMNALGQLNAKMLQLPNPNLIIRPLQRREALTSSAMEGTYSTSDELALLEAGAEQSARAETMEVRNYIRALEYSVEALRHLPLCHRIIKGAHAQLLSDLPGGRGGNKRPGDYKREQNWIGGLTAESARFVPAPPLETAEAMNTLEEFLNRDDPSSLPPLLEAALVHYQFETIHPFVDGNGRVGRILIPLVLLARNAIASPAFYPSAALEMRKSDYVEHMFAVSTKGDWTGWLRFFLGICVTTCNESITIIDRLLSLQNDYRAAAMARFRSNNILQVIDDLFVNPIVSTTTVKDRLSVTRRAARMTIANLEEIGILSHRPGTSMPEYFVARDIQKAIER